MCLSLPCSDYFLLSVATDGGNYIDPFSFLLKKSPYDNYNAKKYEKAVNKKENKTLIPTRTLFRIFSWDPFQLLQCGIFTFERVAGYLCT